MSHVIAWIAAEAESPKIGAGAGFPRRTRCRDDELAVSAKRLPAYQIPARLPIEETTPKQETPERNSFHQRLLAEEDRERQQRTYRGRTVAMLRRYMRYSIETGRLPSLLGQEFFRAKMTAYRWRRLKIESSSYTTWRSVWTGWMNFHDS